MSGRQLLYQEYQRVKLVGDDTHSILSENGIVFMFPCMIWHICVTLVEFWFTEAETGGSTCGPWQWPTCQDVGSIWFQTRFGRVQVVKVGSQVSPRMSISGWSLVRQESPMSGEVMATGWLLLSHLTMFLWLFMMMGSWTESRFSNVDWENEDNVIYDTLSKCTLRIQHGTLPSLCLTPWNQYKVSGDSSCQTGFPSSTS